MKRFTPAEIDQLLAQPAENRATASLPEDFFEQMEQRILAATVEAENESPEAAVPKANTAPVPSVATSAPAAPAPTRHFRIRPLWAAAAAAVVLIVCAFAVRNMHSVAPQTYDTLAGTNSATLETTAGYEADDNLYALTPEADDDDLDDLDEIYEADIFLKEL